MHSKAETPPKNILLVAITRLGDMLQATPTIVGLREENPGARICVLIDRSFSKICEYLPGIDHVYEIDLHFIVRAIAREGEGLVDAFGYFDELVGQLKDENFDYCLNMSSSGYTALLITLLGIKENRGWISNEQGQRLITTPWAQLFAAMIFHQNRDFNSINLVDYFRCSAGVEEHPRSLVCKVTDDAANFAKEFIAENFRTGTGPIIGIQAGASQIKRQWAPANFAKLAKYLVEELDARVLFTGSNSEVPIIEQIFAHYRHENMVIAAGKTNIEQLTGLLDSCDLLVTGDTGPMHIAVATNTPVVATFLASGYCFETGPYGEGHIVMQPQISCNPCNPNYSCSRPDCHMQITPELVHFLVKQRLSVADDMLRTIRVPESLAPASQVAVFLTTFDDDGYLDYLQLNQDGVRKGYTPGFQRIARRAYRTLWKDEFRIANEPQFHADQLPALSEHPDAIFPGIGDIVDLSNKGIALSNQLMSLVGDITSPPALLGKTTRELDELDDEIEAFGLSNPHLGVLTRMFTMEKENMTGDVIDELIDSKRKLYQGIGRRAQKLEKLVDYYYHRKEQI